MGKESVIPQRSASVPHSDSRCFLWNAVVEDEHSVSLLKFLKGFDLLLLHYVLGHLSPGWLYFLTFYAMEDQDLRSKEHHSPEINDQSGCIAHQGTIIIQPNLFCAIHKCL